MKVYDLSHNFNINDLVFPGTPPMRMERTQTYEKDGYNLSLVSVNSHACTHTDAPLHFLPDGKPLSEVDIERYVGPCFIMGIEKDADEFITADEIRPYEKEIREAGRVIFAAGWDKMVNTEDYYTRYPGITIDGAEYLVSLGVKMMGMEGPSINTKDGPEVHKILLGADVAIVEGLANVKPLAGKTLLFCGAPIKFEEMDGFPVRAYAIEL